MDEELEMQDRGDEVVVDDDTAEISDQVEDTEVSAEAEEAEEAEEEAAAPERDDRGHLIPKDRFDEAVRKERTEKEQLAARLQQYEQREAQRSLAADMAEAATTIKSMIKEHTQLLADGELDKASDLMGNILSLQADIAEHRANAVANSAKSQAKEEVQYDAAVTLAEADYPVINPDSPDYDETVVRRVQAYMTGLMQTENMAPAKALRESVETILGSAPAASANSAADLGVRRKEAAVSKALDAKKKQPASTKGVGLDHDKEGGGLDAAAVTKMSWDEFMKLPDSKLAEMRGDFV